MPDITTIYGEPAGGYVPEAVDRTELPMGKYKAEILDSELKEDADGNQRITFKFSVVDNEHRKPEFNGRWFWVDFSLKDTNSQREEIGRKQFASLIGAVKLDQVTDTEAMHGKKCLVTMIQGKPKNNGGHFVNYKFSVDLTTPQSQPNVTDNIKPEPVEDLNSFKALENVDDDATGWG